MLPRLLDIFGNHLVIELLVKGALIIGTTALLVFLARTKSAATRHAVWTMGLGALVVLPVALISVPDWQIRNYLPGTKTAEAESTLGTANNTGMEQTGSTSSVVVFTSATTPANMVEQGMMPPTTEPEESSLRRRLGFSLLIVYAVGLLFSLVVSVRHLFRMAMVTRFGSTPAEGRETELAQTWMREQGMRRGTRILVSHWTQVPITWGVFRPVVLLPPSLEFWSEDRTRAAVLHELAHIRRFDFVWQVVADLAVALHWPNPLVRGVARAMRRESERACDDTVLRAGMASTDYARHLVDIARTTAPGPSGVQVPVAGLAFGTRIDDILRVPTNRLPVSRLPTLAAGVAVMTLGTGIAGASFASAPSEPQTVSDVWALSGNRSPAAVETLIDQLRDGLPAHRAVAALSIGELHAPAGLDPLKAALFDVDPHVRENAAVALTRFGGADLAPFVIPLTRDTVTDVRSVANWVLGELGGERALAALLGVIRREPDAHSRTMAVMAMTEIPEVDQVPSLIALLDEVEGATRFDVTMAMGLTGDPRVVPVLSRLARSDADPSMRRMALRSLGEVDDPLRISIWLRSMDDEDWRVRNQALVLLSTESGPRVRRALLEALNDPQHQVRLNAAWALEGVEQ
jgi:HEAT repeat protein/beta-lactamase regulating signal transducer with metallopeptidase domain